MNLIQLIFATLIIFPATSFADDHIDGPIPTEFPVDLAGIYVFPTPGTLNKHSLTFVVNTQSGVRRNAWFSKRSKFKIELRKISPAPETGKNGRVSNNQKALEVDCSFRNQGLVASRWRKQIVTCRFFSHINQKEIIVEGQFGKILNGHLNSARMPWESGEVKLYTGVRSDPFFISLPAFDDVVLYARPFHDFRERLSKPKPMDISRNARKRAIQEEYQTNGIRNVNVLTIAFRIELDKLGLERGLYGAAAQSFLKPFAGGHFHKVDRTGRPEIVNVGLHDSTKKNYLHWSGDQPLKYRFNTTTMFDPSENLSDFRKRLFKNIQRYDKIDGHRDWNNHYSLFKLSQLLSDDFILINTSQECTNKNTEFFSIEREFVRQGSLENINTCGGRDIDDDIFRGIYSLYIGGIDSDPNSEDYNTGVNKPFQSFSLDRQLSDQLPYLPSPVGFDLGEAASGLLLHFRNQERRPNSLNQSQ